MKRTLFLFIITVFTIATGATSAAAQASSSAPRVNGIQGSGPADAAGFVSISIGDATAVEGAGSIAFTVTLSDQAAANVSVDYGTSDGTATAGSDYTQKSGTLTIPAGATSGTITVTLLDDNIDENSETFTVNLSNPSSNADITDAQAVGTITDDDPAPSVSINSVSGNESAATLGFTVSLSAPSSKTVSVDYATHDGTATAASDYTAKSGTITFIPGITSTTVAVSLLDDALDEDDETFTVDLSNPGNATLGTAQGVGTILDDDPMPALSIAGNTVDENAGTLTLTVTLSVASGRQVQVDYSTSDGTATAGSDYVAAAGTLTFPAGTTTNSITVTITDDSIDEPDETFFVDLGNAQNASIAAGQGIGTIIDDDLPTLGISDATGNEADGSLVFTVSLSNASDVTILVQFSTVDGTAVAGSDYTASSGILIIPAGSTGNTIEVAITDDALYEADETFEVVLSNPTNAMFGADSSATGTILNDDLPLLSIGDATAAEDAGSMEFTVTLTPAVAKTVTVDFATQDSTATGGADFAAVSGSLVFAANTTTRTFSVSITDDALDEDDEVFAVVLSAPSNAAIADGVGIGTITDNDDPPTLAIDDVSLDEPGTGSTAMAFAVSLSAVSGREIKVDYSTRDSSATAPDDYLAASGTLVIPAGTQGATIDVTVNSDALDEVDEFFFVELANPINAGITDAQGLGTIIGNVILSVELQTFTAITGERGVDLAWATGSETDNQGFYVYRSAAADTGYQQLNAEIIPGAGTTTEPQEYAYSDTNVVSGETWYYKLASVHAGGSLFFHGPVEITVGPITGIDDQPRELLPEVFALFQNYPNPFNPSTVIRLQLPKNSHVQLVIYNAAGQRVRSLVAADLAAGSYDITWNGLDDAGRRVASGIYLYQMRAENFAAQKKLLLLK